MNIHTRIILGLWIGFSGLAPAETPGFANVVWDSPSKDARGSMPLGNGDIGMNAWVEASGDLVVLISKTDSWDDYGRLVKIGQIRVRLDPAPAISPFRQELAVDQGMMKIRYGDGTELSLWADANHPTIHVEASSPRPVAATLTNEPWRTEPRTLATHECSDVLNHKPGNPPMFLEPDTVVTGLKDSIAWYHHNRKSVGPEEHASIQGMSGFSRPDPLLHRTFGAMVTADHARRLDDKQLRSEPATSHHFAIHVLTKTPATPQQWLSEAGTLAKSSSNIPLETRRNKHLQWWREFWNRSWIRAKATTPPPPAPANHHPLKAGEDQNGANRFVGTIGKPETPASFDKPFTITAEVRPGPAATGRIFDKITAGGTDGFLLDLPSPGTLRLIVGTEQKTTASPLQENRASAVALVAATSGVTVTVDGRTVLSLPAANTSDDADHLSRMVTLQRYITACAGRGAFPIKFNGSIFTMPYQGDPDYRKWGPGYWWQNTRLPYISACANGDMDLLEPLFAMYADRLLPLNTYRTETYFGFKQAAFFPECVLFWGDVFNETYGWTPMKDRKDPLQESGWHKREWVAGPELVWMMIDAYEHGGDESLLRKRLIPTAAAVIRFFDRFYPTDASGRLVMHPSQALETWWDCTDPMPELAGLRAITARLLALPAGKIPADTRAEWSAFAAKLAPLPIRNIPNEGPALAPAAKFANKPNVENPELYAVFPFRLCSFEKDNRDLGIRALKHRWDRGHAGWRQDDVFMAYLGLVEDSRAAVVSRSRNSDKGSRFPAFWGPNYDWIPDQDHGGVLVKATQAMLLQTDGDRIFLLPAWPQDWNVSFKLHAPKQTTIECVVENGKVTRLDVSPSSRRKDVTACGPYSLPQPPR